MEWDSCRKIILLWVMLGFEWIERDTIFLWILSPILGVISYEYLQQQIYGWVECSSYAFGFTFVDKR